MARSLWFTAAVSKRSALKFHVALTMTLPSTHSREKNEHQRSICFENENPKKPSVEEHAPSRHLEIGGGRDLKNEI